MATPTITHVIFDMDGLLLDTEGFYTLVQEKILEPYGKKFDWELKAQMMGRKAIESARIFVEASGLTGVLSPEEFLDERERMLQELFPSCTLLPGTVLCSRNYEVVSGAGKGFCALQIRSRTLGEPSSCKGDTDVCCDGVIPFSLSFYGTYYFLFIFYLFCLFSSHQRHFSLKTQNHGKLFSLMHHVVKGDDPEVKQGKPSPDVFLAALRRFEGNVDASNCLVFEDAPTGVAAAKNAGMSVVMVPDERLDLSYRKQADQVISSLLEFQPEYWGLPPFED
ncbi:hypothetical protein LUZ63_006500 [Rhynchospora breviuscula]|uniref:(DL)-glycerol-3-phosphatase 2 n=1 Tax=Rhynchospora breviuscula TaxID=2022672 RepID=A0A9Q0CPX8_9POAL|nr:hypothetical protein LUZ63_006500 [Rhynchospora breviuscula]